MLFLDWILKFTKILLLNLAKLVNLGAVAKS